MRIIFVICLLFVSLSYLLSFAALWSPVGGPLGSLVYVSFDFVSGRVEVTAYVCSSTDVKPE